MELFIKDIQELLGVPEKTVLKWINEKKLPAYKINNRYRFSRSEMQEWVLKNNYRTTGKVMQLCAASKPVVLAELVQRGGILCPVRGKSAIEVIKDAVEHMDVPVGITKQQIIFSLLEREEMMPTAIGRGIAIPHPRNPILADTSRESITICMLERPIAYGAMDGQPVHTLMVVLSANPIRHLEILSRISYLCHQGDFISLLSNRASPKALMEYLVAIEASIPEKRS